LTLNEQAGYCTGPGSKGRAMDKQKQQPSKESVRAWLRTEIAQRRPPPDPAQIRRELGWDLIPVPSERKR
jgi:hypothetical protein